MTTRKPSARATAMLLLAQAATGCASGGSTPPSSNTSSVDPRPPGERDPQLHVTLPPPAAGPAARGDAGIQGAVAPMGEMPGMSTPPQTGSMPMASADAGAMAAMPSMEDGEHAGRGHGGMGGMGDAGAPNAMSGDAGARGMGRRGGMGRMPMRGPSGVADAGRPRPPPAAPPMGGMPMGSGSMPHE